MGKRGHTEEEILRVLREADCRVRYGRARWIKHPAAQIGCNLGACRCAACECADYQKQETSNHRCLLRKRDTPRRLIRHKAKAVRVWEWEGRYRLIPVLSNLSISNHMRQCICSQLAHLVFQTFNHDVCRLDKSCSRVTLLQVQLPRGLSRDDCRNLSVSDCQNDFCQKPLDSYAHDLPWKLVAPAYPSIALS